MGDSICKWRAARPHNVVELVNLLPHSEMPDSDFREYMEKLMPGFFHTPYQLACQLGLYFVDENGVYHPRFDHDIDEAEAESYLRVLVTKYYVPNPYTPRGFKNLPRPILLERSLVEYLESVGGSSDLEQALRYLIKEDVGNLTATKTLLSYSTLLEFQGNTVSLTPNYKDLMELPIDRKDKSAFFKIFSQQMTDRKIEGPLQLIYFGAPGTGKSHRIKQACGQYDHFRITFHPDTDYASFVGSYKPSVKQIKLRDLSGHVVKEDGKELMEDKIVYSFVKQAFLNAYIAAWRNQENAEPKPVFLVIEEINRGNCAQIFGDIFQLLDRNNSGFSDYPIVADTDLQKELAHEFASLEVANADAINSIYSDDVVAKLKNGTHLLLPNNLYIWATMNTSDQSLFPIDSAFKRRWEWKYVKIADSGRNYRIAVNGKQYDWWKFVCAVNDIIGGEIEQEDKKLGYFFAKAKENADGNLIISADTLLSKVIFFLYNDVFKDYGFDYDCFKGEDDEPMAFADYFDEFGDTVEPRVELFIKNLGIKPIGEETDEATPEEETTTEEAE